MITVGNDIVEVDRINKVLSRPTAQAFVNRVFTQNEQDYCEKMANKAAHYGARWALKEAFYKALPEELQSLSTFKSIELSRIDGRKPKLLVLSNELKIALENFGIVGITHSISHEKNYCIATVIMN